MRASHRLDVLRTHLSEDGPAAIVLTDPVNVAYVTGFEGVFDGEAAHAVVVTSGDAWIYTDSRYGTALSHAAQGSAWDVRVVTENLYVTLCGDLMAASIESIALESSAPHGRFRFISREFDGKVEAVDQLVEDIRQVKDAEEIARIEAAQALADAAFEHIVGVIRAGLTEADVALELEFHMRRAGSDGVAFPPIVASGPNSAMPHARVTHRVIEAGDFVTLDFGARVDGYCSDMTRTLVIGQANERQREIHDLVQAANRAGIEAVKPGLQGSAIDAAARDVIAAGGFGEYFGHGLGHGVGLEVHESPSVSPRGNKSVRAGSVITIEPGIYVPGFGGVRIEDLVVVEEGGARVLTSSAKDLIEI